MKRLTPAVAVLLAAAATLPFGAQSQCYIATCGSHGTLVTWDGGCACSCATGWTTNPYQDPGDPAFAYCTFATTAAAPPPPPPEGTGPSPDSSPTWQPAVPAGEPPAPKRYKSESIIQRLGLGGWIGVGAAIVVIGTLLFCCCKSKCCCNAYASCFSCCWHGSRSAPAPAPGQQEPAQQEIRKLQEAMQRLESQQRQQAAQQQPDVSGAGSGGSLRTSFVLRLLAKVRSSPDPMYAGVAAPLPPPSPVQMQYSPPLQYSPQPPSLESQLLQAVQRQQQEEALMARLASGGGSPVAASLAASTGGWGISPLQQRAYAAPAPAPLAVGAAQDPAVQLLLLQQQQQLQQLHQQLQHQSQPHP